MTENIPPILRPDNVTGVSLQNLAEQFKLETPAREHNPLLTGISMNTADLRPGDLFVAMPGKKTHGANFIARAIELGAVAVITDSAGLEELRNQSFDHQDIPVLALEDPRTHLGDLAAFVYGNNAGNIPKLFATTGTNGKTS
ncbi:MAG: UDP-N-acetylmuramoyl-L-alanyl-D-glutamate--2,6-diaminopimelate ligase, partial [Actinobacteria bacterium]|nr:UDP-N-acetylmuramoyl-L-alanyl-D-glutamate--2,6-diaminopimelate ligase [Actinomycetota bacterium]